MPPQPDAPMGESMQQLTARLEALDPAAGKVLKALAYFDKLIESRAGTEGFVRGAAVLGGYTAGLSDSDSSVYIRIDPDGRRLTDRVVHDDRWLTRTLDPGWPAQVWLETTEQPGAAEEMVIDRLALGTRLVLERTRGRLRTPDEGAIEVLLDESASVELRMRTANSLGFADDDRLRALAVLEPYGLDAGGHGRSVVKPHVRRSGSEPLDVPGRIGIGLSGGILDLPRSYRTAVAALRFTTDGRGGEPGPLHTSADSMGGLLPFAENDELRRQPIKDVELLNEAALRNVDLLVTLDSFITHASARAAADALHLHHSTMQQRLQQAEKSLGWPLNSATGRFRLQLAMSLRLIQRDDI
ncbi:MAG TPA: helix-turn-helix domain-containing protein [Pseudolysinimonas sp.]|nr:helix-turn-helix domain-containing protein [Pseudolysinimonas sp.]